MKNIWYTLLWAAFLSMISCQNSSSSQQDFTLLVQLPDSVSQPKIALENTRNILLHRLSSANLTAKQVSIQEKDHTITINGVSGQGAAAPGQKFIQDLLTQEGNLRFRPCLNADEAGLATTLQAADQEQKLYRRFQPMLSAGMHMGFLGSADAANRDSIVDLLGQERYKKMLGMPLTFEWSTQPEQQGEERQYLLYALADTAKPAQFIDNRAIKSVQLTHAGSLGDPSIEIEMTPEAIPAFTAMTQHLAADSHRALAVELDGTVLFAPKVMSAIDDGKFQVTVRYTPNEIARLVNMLQGGRLPYPVRIVGRQ